LETGRKIYFGGSLMNNKPVMLIVGPLSTRSGYGEHARDLFHSFYDLNRFNIKVMDVRWGDTPRNALKSDNKKDKIILESILTEKHQLTGQPDICVDIRIPNEFQPIGKYNIGITAGIETTGVSTSWLEGCNRMDLIIVPSKHSKKGFVDTTYDKAQKMPDGTEVKMGELKLEKPMEVLFEGEDISIWKPLKDSELKTDFVDNIDKMVTEDFAFLFVGQWVKGEYGEDRKDIGRMLKVFFQTFANQENPPAMILKTSGAGYSVMDREETKRKISLIKNMFPKNVKLPKVYLIHGELTSEELNQLYNHPKVKAMMSMTHGEGFGRPLLEASMAGLPVAASNWSGQIDFLDPQYSVLIGGALSKVPASAVWQDIVIPESSWFVVNEEEASKAFQYMYSVNDKLQENAKKLSKINRDKFSHSAMTKGLGEILDKHMKLSKPVELKLPKLKSIKKEAILDG
tara:strand:+ start:1837 stop:3207 length:1371 start_codon:yes stop_codon:yes gene_type:complete